LISRNIIAKKYEMEWILSIKARAIASKNRRIMVKNQKKE
jgi:hypothetical protein